MSNITVGPFSVEFEIKFASLHFFVPLEHDLLRAWEHSPELFHNSYNNSNNINNKHNNDNNNNISINKNNNKTKTTTCILYTMNTFY